MNDVRVFDEVCVFGFSQLPPPLNSHPCLFFDAAVTAGVDRNALAIRRPTQDTASMINQTIDQSFLIFGNSTKTLHCLTSTKYLKQS